MLKACSGGHKVRDRRHGNRREFTVGSGNLHQWERSSFRMDAACLSTRGGGARFVSRTKHRKNGNILRASDPSECSSPLSSRFDRSLCWRALAMAALVRPTPVSSSASTSGLSHAEMVGVPNRGAGVSALNQRLSPLVNSSFSA